MGYLQDYQKWGESGSKFIFTQAESELKQLIDAGRLITDRAYRLLVMCSTIFLAIIGYGVNKFDHWSKHDHLSDLDYVAIFASLILFSSLVLIMQIIFPASVQPVGRNPDDFLSQEQNVIKTGRTSEEIAGCLLFIEIRSYQNRIRFNEKNNGTRSKKLKWILWLLALILPISLIIVLL
jgi:hypothetical protein